MLKVFVPPSLRHFEPKRVVPGPSSQQIPLDYDLVEALRPRLVVDAGTGDGNSFFAYCQSLEEHDIGGVAYGIDGFPEGAPEDSKASFDAINAHGRAAYPGIYYLIREEPAGAHRHFSRASIDLLRIDASRPALAEPHVIEAWISRVRPGGVLVLSGANADVEALPALGEPVDRVAFEGGQRVVLARFPGGEPPRAELLRLAFVEKETTALAEFYRHVREHHQLRRALSKLG